MVRFSYSAVKFQSMGGNDINQVLFYDLNIYMLPFRETCLLNFRQFCILKLIHYFNIYRFLSEVLVKAHNVIIYIHATVYNFWCIWFFLNDRKCAFNINTVNICRYVRHWSSRYFQFCRKWFAHPMMGLKGNNAIPGVIWIQYPG